MDPIENAKKCNCTSDTCPNVAPESTTTVKKSLRALPSIVLSILVAFFPKCPMCWAVYMSMLGSFGVVKIPYKSWILPVLLIFLGVHLWILYKKIVEKGYGPFVCSIVGFGFLFLGKVLLVDEHWILLCGIFFIFLGSLWNSFSFKSMQTVIN